MSTNLYSRLNNCAEWRIYKDTDTDTAHNNKSRKYFSLEFRDSDFLDCFEGAGICNRCYFISDNRECTIDPIIIYLMDSIKQLTNDNYISITPKSYPGLFV